MKKNGFTLAEVLITLAIIGVVATMTLPALMTNTQEQQAKTGLKKGINTLTEAVQMHEAVSGISYTDLTQHVAVSAANVTAPVGRGANEVAENSLFGLLKERTQIDFKRTTEALTSTNDAYIKQAANSSLTGVTGGSIVHFNDGTALLFGASSVSTVENAVEDTDGLIKGYTVIYDTNGSKGPNVLSNCTKKPLGADDNATEVKQCDTKANRVIKDQFQLQLRGNTVKPRGAAATWAFTN